MCSVSEVRMVCVHGSLLGLDMFMERRYGLALVLVQLGHDEAQNLLLQIRVFSEGSQTVLHDVFQDVSYVSHTGL